MAEWHRIHLLLQETWVWSLGQRDYLEKMATHSNVFAWEILWTEEPDRLQSMGSHRVGHDLATKQWQQVHLFIWLCWVLVAACENCHLCFIMETLYWELQNLVPWPEIEPGSPALWGKILSHYTTKKVPHPFLPKFMPTAHLVVIHCLQCLYQHHCEGSWKAWLSRSMNET